MRPAEAEWIRDRLLEIGPEAASPIANIGSSTEEFRTVRKPHIDRLLVKPLVEAGFEWVHVDLKDAPGVDLAGDLNDAEFVARVQKRGCRSMICSNLLEHVTDPQRIVNSCEQLMHDQAYLVFTVPRRYPYHADPIDTMFRPSVADLEEMFGCSTLVTGIDLEDGTLWQEERRRGARSVLRMVAAWVWHLARWRVAPEVAKSVLAKIRHLFRPVSVTCVVFQRR